MEIETLPTEEIQTEDTIQTTAKIVTTTITMTITAEDTAAVTADTVMTITQRKATAVVRTAVQVLPITAITTMITALITEVMMTVMLMIMTMMIYMEMTATHLADIPADMPITMVSTIIMMIITDMETADHPDREETTEEAAARMTGHGTAADVLCQNPTATGRTKTRNIMAATEEVLLPGTNRATTTDASHLTTMTTTQEDGLNLEAATDVVLHAVMRIRITEEDILQAPAEAVGRTNMADGAIPRAAAKTETAKEDIHPIPREEITVHKALPDPDHLETIQVRRAEIKNVMLRDAICRATQDHREEEDLAAKIPARNPVGQPPVQKINAAAVLHRTKTRATKTTSSKFQWPTA